MEKLQSQLPQPLKRCSPSRNGDPVTQIKNSNSPLTNRSPARRIVTSSPNNIRSRDTAAATLTSKQPEVKARSPEVPSRSRDTTATPTRRPQYSPAVNGNMSPVARGKLNGQQCGTESSVSDVRHSPVKSIAAKLPVKTKSAKLRSLRPTAESKQLCDDKEEKDEVGETVPPWTQNSQPSRLGFVSGIKKSLSPKCDRRKAEHLENVEDEEKNNGGGGSPIYHELDPPGTCHFPIQHTYQSIVEISDELESLRIASMRPEVAAAYQGNGVASQQQQLSRTRSAQELAQKSPTKLSLFSRFRFTGKKSSAKTSGKAGRTISPPEVRGQSSLQDVDLITRSRDEEGVASCHDRQPSFTTFAHRVPRSSAAACDSDGYSTVYVPRNLSERPNTSAPVPPRSSSLIPTSNKPAVSEPLYKQKFLKIASVHTLQSSAVSDDSRLSLTSSNSVGDLLSATDVGHRSPQRVTSYDDHAVTIGSRKMAASANKRADCRSQIARFALSPGRGSSFASPSCGIRMAEMRGAVRRCTNDGSVSPSTSTSRSPSASTPVPSPARLSVFQFNVPPPGVMMSPPVQRAYRHVSSQTVMSVRPPSASCILSITAVHGPSGGPLGQMQTIEEEDDDSFTDDAKSTFNGVVPAGHQQSRDDRSRRNGVQATRTVVSGDVEQSRDKVAARKRADDDCRMVDGDTAQLRTQSETKTSRLRRPSPSVASKPVAHGCASPLLDHHSSRIVPPSVSTHRRVESSSVSPPSTPRSVDSPARPGPSRGELARRPITRGQQQQRKQLAPPADGEATITAAQIGDGLLVSGARKQGPRRLLAPADGPSSASGSPNLSSSSSLSLLSNGSDVDVLAGPSAPPEPTADASASQSRTSSADSRSIQHKHSTLPVTTSRVGKLTELTIPAHTDHGNY